MKLTRLLLKRRFILSTGLFCTWGYPRGSKEDVLPYILSANCATCLFPLGGIWADVLIEGGGLSAK